MLWAHLHEPESAFARLPLELVVCIMQHLNAPGLAPLFEGMISPVREFAALSLVQCTTQNYLTNFRFTWQASIDRSFEGELHAHFLSVARALYASDLKLALTIVFKHMQESLERYRSAQAPAPFLLHLPPLRRH